MYHVVCPFTSSFHRYSFCISMVKQPGRLISLYTKLVYLSGFFVILTNHFGVPLCGTKRLWYPIPSTTTLTETMWRHEDSIVDWLEEYSIIELTCFTNDQIRLLFSSATSSVWHASPCWQRTTTLTQQTYQHYIGHLNSIWSRLSEWVDS